MFSTNFDENWVNYSYSEIIKSQENIHNQKQIERSLELSKMNNLEKGPIKSKLTLEMNTPLWKETYMNSNLY